MFLGAEKLLEQTRAVSQQRLSQRSGVKDYQPDGSTEQSEKLARFYEQRHSFLTEERVRRIGSLGRGEWDPSLGRVVVTKDVNNFWRHFGHTEDRKMLLFPEEALFLLDASIVEIYFGGVPFSLQQAYATLLGDHLPLHHYQVYAHLARLGYVLKRHESSAVVTEYEKELAPEACRVGSGQRRKRRGAEADGEDERDGGKKQKAEDDPATDTAASVEEEENGMEVDNASRDSVRSTTGNCEAATVDAIVAGCRPQEGSTGQPTERASSGATADHARQPPVSYSDWDFEHIRLPSLPGRHTDGSRWRGDGVAARNWGEHKRRVGRLSEADILEVSPARHLWRGDVKPLVKPAEATSVEAILKKLQVVRHADEISQSQSPSKKGCLSEVIYDVYLPDANFKKTNHGPPDHCVCIVEQRDPVPSVGDVVRLTEQCAHGTPLHWAVVDNGNVAFYCFTSARLPPTEDV